jgi:hypothetical protein
MCVEKIVVVALAAADLESAQANPVGAQRTVAHTTSRRNFNIWIPSNIGSNFFNLISRTSAEKGHRSRFFLDSQPG